MIVYARKAGVQRPKSKAAFTLIELLVVVAIIAVLISILLPALTQARESARGAVCATQLKQIAMALQFYAEDNQGWVPAYYWYASGGPSTNACCYWTDVLIALNYLSKENNASVLVCPSGLNQISADRNYTNYACNVRFDTSGASGRPGCFGYVGIYSIVRGVISGGFSYGYGWGTMTKLSRYESPADTMGLAEGPYMAAYYPHLEFISTRHNRGANMMYFDWHVAWRRCPKFDDNPSLPASNIPTNSWSRFWSPW